MLKPLLAALGVAIALIIAPVAVGSAAADVTGSESGGTAPVSHNFGVATVSGTYTTIAGTAVAGEDFTAVSGTFTVLGAYTVFVPILDDTVHEATETFTVRFTLDAGGGAFDEVVTITDDDAAPTLAINDVAQSEATTPLTLTVTLTGATALVTTVQYATADGAAVAGSDYTAASGTLTFPPGTLTQTIPITIANDAFDEVGESFTVNLTNPVNATISDAQGFGTIGDDDIPSISINDVTVSESAATATFTVTITPAPATGIAVPYSTANGTATATQDYTSASGHLNFGPATTTLTVSVSLLGDSIDEAAETFTVNLGTIIGSATMADGIGVGTITDDDPAPSIEIQPESSTVTEGGPGDVTTLTFTITRLAPSGQDITFNVFGVSGTATQGVDFDAPVENLTIPAGSGGGSATYTLDILGDGIDEPTEAFTVEMDDLQNAGLGEVSFATVNIRDDDVSLSALGLTGSAPLPWLAFGGMLLLAGIASVAVAVRRRRLSA